MKQPEPVSHFRRLESPEPVHRYLALKDQIKALSAEMKELEAEVWDAVDDEGGAVTFAGHVLETAVAKTYTYSPAVDEAEAALRSMKDAERKRGTATVERATGYVRVTVSKVEEGELLDAVAKRTRRERAEAAA